MKSLLVFSLFLFLSVASFAQAGKYGHYFVTKSTTRLLAEPDRKSSPVSESPEGDTLVIISIGIPLNDFSCWIETVADGKRGFVFYTGVNKEESPSALRKGLRNVKLEPEERAVQAIAYDKLKPGLTTESGKVVPYFYKGEGAVKIYDPSANFIKDIRGKELMVIYAVGYYTIQENNRDFVSGVYYKAICDGQDVLINRQELDKVADGLNKDGVDYLNRVRYLGEDARRTEAMKIYPVYEEE